MKSIALIFLSAAFAYFGLSVEAVYAEIAGLVAATITLAEAANTAFNWHKARAVLSTIGVAALLTLIGWQLVEASYIYGTEFVKALENFVLVSLGALGLWSNYKKAVESV